MTDPTMPAWHALPPSEVIDRLEARETGLTSEEAARLREKYGPNRLPHAPPPAWWQIVLRQFQSPLIYILMIAAAVSLLIGHAEDAGVIAVVLLLNAAIGGYQEWQAERSSQALQALLHVRAMLLRDGEVVEVDAEEIVPGDVALLESGNHVPADLRLIQAHGLEIDESLLTGESVPVPKDVDWLGEAESSLADRLNMAFGGSTVARGRARGIVVATGDRTAVGQLALDVTANVGGKPPLLERMERFTRGVAVAILTAALVIALVGIFLRGYEVTQMFIFGVALAVSAIPEGLPISLTVALAIATTRMARRGVIVRRLAAVEGLGSCTLIASDKTGTLTCNQLTVRAVCLPDGTSIEVTGEGYSPTGEILCEGKEPDEQLRAAVMAVARASVLCNEADLHQRKGEWVWRGDPTEVALLSFGHKLGLVRDIELTGAPQVGQIPFEPERQYSATFHQVDGRVQAFVKGAPERVLTMCVVSDDERGRILEFAENLASQGYRVLALARGGIADGEHDADPPVDPKQLEFLGLTGMIDPLRPGVRDAVAACQDAGIAVCMITGDHPVTALAIARDLGFAESPDQVLTGRDIAEMSAEQLAEAVRRVRVFARTTPRQKLELVGAARKMGYFVAVTGDGVNDAPALRESNIGVAMGQSGTDVAREAAELVITDDNFATIVAGIEEGRVAYDNVRKVVYLLVSTGAAEVLLLGIVVLTGWPNTDAGAVLPLLPVQILWLNLVTNGIQDKALAFEPAEGDILSRPPRPPSQRIFDRLMIERTVVAAVVMAGVGFAAFAWMIEVAGWTPEKSRNALLMLMVLFQNLHIGNSRSETRSVFSMSPLRSPILLAATLSAFSVHMAATRIPLSQRLLHVEPVDLATFGAMLLLALTIIVGMEIHKWVWHRRHVSLQPEAKPRAT